MTKHKFILFFICVYVPQKISCKKPNQLNQHKPHWFGLILFLKANWIKSNHTHFSLTVFSVKTTQTAQRTSLPIGKNLNRKDTWNRVIKTLKFKLSKWKKEHLFIGNRIVTLKCTFDLVSLILQSSTIYYLYWNIFLNTSCEGIEDDRKIDWIKWKKVCKTIEEGGWGLKILGFLISP